MVIQSLDILQKRGASYVTEDSTCPLAYAYLHPDLNYCRLLFFQEPEKQLELVTFPVHAADFDPHTDKFYVAYSGQEYFQIRPTALFDLPEQRVLMEKDYLKLTNEILPPIAVNQNWPVQENHCFQRIILDHLFQDCWYKHLDRKSTPAYRQLDNLQLGTALYLAYQMQYNDRHWLTWLNQCSLDFRKK